MTGEHVAEVSPSLSTFLRCTCSRSNSASAPRDLEIRSPLAPIAGAWVSAKLFSASRPSSIKGIDVVDIELSFLEQEVDRLRCR